MDSPRLEQQVARIKNDLQNGVSPIEVVLALQQLAKDHRCTIGDLTDLDELRCEAVEVMQRQWEVLERANLPEAFRLQKRAELKVLAQNLAAVLDNYEQLASLRAMMEGSKSGHPS